MSLNSFSDESSPLLDIHAGPTGLQELDDLAFSGEDTQAEPSFRFMAGAWVLTAALVRFLFVARLPLGNGEAYYYSWSRFLDWSYYDHPPLVAWMARLTTTFGTSPATVHLGPILACAAFGYLFYRLAERLFRPRAAFIALVLVTALPVFLGSSFVLNPEAPLAPLWVGFLLVVEGMRKRDEWHRPVLAGVLLGFAFLAKYTAVLLVPAVILYVATSATTRRWLRRPSFYAGGAIALLIALPVLIWNEQRGWPSLHLHLVERAGASLPVAGENTVSHLFEVSSTTGTGLLESIVRLLVGQLMSYSPLLAPLLVIGLVRSLRRARRDDRDLFVSAFSWPVLLVLLAAMARLKDAEQHWTMVGFIPAAMAAGHYVDEVWSRSKTVRFLAAGGVGLTGAAFVLANIHARTPALLKMIPSDHYDSHADMINELIGWDQVRASVAQVASTAPGIVVLASNHYSMCGRLFFEMGDGPAVYCPTAKRSAFDFFGRKEPPSDATVVTLTTDIHPELPAGLSDRKCVLSDQVDVERGGRQVARYFVQSCPPVAADSEMRASRD